MSGDRVPVRLARQSFGAGPPLLFLHGLFGSGRNFRTLARSFAQSFTCCLVDLRNHGESPHVRPADYPAMAEDVLALLDAEGWPCADLVGHSMGGKVAMSIALRHPERVRRLAVLDIAPVRYAHSHRELIEQLLALDLSQVRRRAEADAALAAVIPDPVLRGFLLQNLVFDDAGRARWRIALEILRDDIDRLVDFPLPPEVAACDVPALFLRGGRSDYVPDSTIPVIRRLFPQAVVETIADAGHWLHADKAEAVRDRLLAFLTS